MKIRMILVGLFSLFSACSDLKVAVFGPIPALLD